ncbi:MAG TPA: adenylate/guanylate cyclase domain-containing protein [Acidimicrobiia bacterium]|nr:adenylate/guanylate cyclase domain-containing protein [Acidimicrobiia bacterium]
MPGFLKRSLDEPDVFTRFELGEERIVDVGDLSFTKTVLHPGWHWQQHVGPIAGTQSCRFSHFFVVAAGHLQLTMDDGTVHDLRAGDVADVPPGHDGRVVGDEPVVLYSPSGARDWARLPPPGERLLTTLLFTDVVGSTQLAERLGDAQWKSLLHSFLRTTRLHLDRYRGHLISTTGDGVLARFDSPGRAVRCAQHLVEAAHQYDLRIRAGIHSGEVELMGHDVRGVAVHVAARVLALAEADEILLTETTRQLVAGSSLQFSDRGEHHLKGVSDPRRIFAFTGETVSEDAFLTES